MANEQVPSKEQVCEHTKVFVTDATMRRMQVPCPWCKDAEIERLKQRCNPSKVVMIGDAGHYVSEAVSAEIEHLRGAVTSAMDRLSNGDTEGGARALRECFWGTAHEPPADAEKVLETYDQAWLEDQQLGLCASETVPPSALKRARERFNAARAAVLAAMRPASPPPDELQALRHLAQWCWSYRAELEKDVLDNDQDVVETRDKMFAALDAPTIGLRPTLTKPGEQA